MGKELGPNIEKQRYWRIEVKRYIDIADESRKSYTHIVYVNKDENSN